VVEVVVEAVADHLEVVEVVVDRLEVVEVVEDLLVVEDHQQVQQVQDQDKQEEGLN